MAENKNAQIAAEVLAAVGGKENVVSVTHCLTRLRFNLKDMSLPDKEKINQIKGVLGVVESGGQFQVIVGQNVPKVYNVLCEQGGFEKLDAIDENLDAPKEKLTLKGIGSRIMNYLAGSMVPLQPLLMAAGLIKTLSTLLGPGILGIISETDGLYILLDFMFDAGFYFMPILVGYNAAKKLKVPAMLGAYLGAILMAPDFMQMATDGTELSIFGLSVITDDYSQSLMPILLSVLLMALVYRVIVNIVPDALAAIFNPFLTILISTPIALLWLAPLGTILSGFVSTGLNVFTEATGFVGYAVIGALWEFLVMTGMHIPVIIPFQMEYMQTGFMAGAIQGASCATWACFGVALGAFLRLKNKEEKNVSLGYFISGTLGGVTEPTLYGLCFKYRRCFISLAIGGAIGGAYAGITNVVSYMMASSNIMSVLGYAGGSTANLINGTIACVLSLVVAAIATYLIGFSKEELKA